VEWHLDEGADAGLQPVVELVRERAVQRQQGPVDTDGDGPGEDLS